MEDKRKESRSGRRPPNIRDACMRMAESRVLRTVFRLLHLLRILTIPTSMAVTMNVDEENFPKSSPAPESNGFAERHSQSPPPDSRESVPPTAVSPLPVPDSSAQIPLPTPTPKPQGPYVPNYQPHLILSGHSRSISSVKFSPDGSMLASCGEFSSMRAPCSECVLMHHRK